MSFGEEHTLLGVAHPADAGEARRVVATLASQLGFDEADVGRAALVATEAATNLCKHAGRGELLVRRVHEPGEPVGIELLALDKGPGMRDVARCLEDGYSTAGSPGTGFGALRRLASVFDLYSLPGKGTAVLARVHPRRSSPEPDGALLQVGSVLVAAPGEPVSGDGFRFKEAAGRAVLFVADGLGHGRLAAVAAQEAARVFELDSQLSPDRLLERMHGALRSTRGAAVSIAELELTRGQVRYTGVGNVSARLVTSDSSRSMVCQNGTLGVEIRKVTVFEYPLAPESTLIMHSDGLTSRWTLDEYPGLLARHPSLVAAVLYRDFVRGQDDTTVVVVRRRRPAP